jgi:hypothetical protein
VSERDRSEAQEAADRAVEMTDVGVADARALDIEHHFAPACDRLLDLVEPDRLVVGDVSPGLHGFLLMRNRGPGLQSDVAIGSAAAAIARPGASSP